MLAIVLYNWRVISVEPCTSGTLNLVVLNFSFFVSGGRVLHKFPQQVENAAG